jgi:hypothetical protein
MEQPQEENNNNNEDPTTTYTAAATASVPIPSFNFTYLATHPTSWDPNSLEIPLNIRLDGCIVPSDTALEGARISFSHVAVLDGLVDDAVRKEIQKLLLVSSGDKSNNSSNSDGVRHLPSEKWERKTADMAGAAPTWGLKAPMLETLLGSQTQREQEKGGGGAADSSSVPAAVLEIQSRLVKLYPEYRIAYLPSQAIQTQQQQQQKVNCNESDSEDGRESDEEEEEEEEEEHDLEKKKQEKEHQSTSKRPKLDISIPKHNTISSSSGIVDCCPILANAAAHGDTFRYHVDADPTSFPPSTWTQSFGEYFNGEPGKPLLVTLLIYIDDTWERDWGGETLFLDGTTDTGIYVRPKPGRAILMEQDVVHKVNPPSSLAEGRLRLSLVWKLAFIAKNRGEEVKMARKEWGQPTSFGSAARVDAVKRQLLAETKNQHK